MRFGAAFVAMVTLDVTIEALLPSEVAVRAKRKLDLIDSAASLAFLRVPPGNRLEALAGSRAGQHSVRVNDQWRICFRWRDGNAFDVEFCDYH
jgi:proteic killer suppression protein